MPERPLGRLARRLRAHASVHNIPMMGCETKERKNPTAVSSKRTGFAVLFAILVDHAPAPVWNVKKTKRGL